MTAAAPTIAFLGLFGSPNLGNEATLWAFLENVRARLPGVRFLCIAPSQSQVGPMYGIDLRAIDPWPMAARFWRLRPDALRTAAIELAERCTEPRRRRLAAEALAGVDLLVIPGTGLIDDFGQRPLDMPTHLDRWTAAAQHRGVPVAFLSVGVSTIKHPASQALFARSLARAGYCSFRDAASAGNATALGHGPNGVVCPDLAFSLPARDWPADRRTAAHRAVGVGVMGYFGWNASAEQGRRIYATYRERLDTLVRGLLDRGLHVHLLGGDTRADQGTVDEVRAAHAQHGADRLHAPRIGNFRDVLDAIAATDLVVASRFHNILLALKMGRQAISLGYSDKNDAVMSLFGLQAYCHDIERFDPAAVLAQVDALTTRHEPAYDDLPQVVQRAREQLAGQYDALCRPWMPPSAGLPQPLQGAQGMRQAR